MTVTPLRHGLVMDDTKNDTKRCLRGIELRYVLTTYLFDHGPATVAELANAVASQGFWVEGRSSKAISDALRWECGYGRVRRFRRGRYGPGWMPRGTEHRVHRRVMALRAEVAALLMDQCEVLTPAPLR